MNSSTFHFKTFTLGCRVNQYETEYVRQALLGAGWRDAADDEPVDLCIVNTCTVTLEGDYKSRKLIRALAREHPHAKIVVMGCYAARAPGEVAALPGVVEVVADKRELPGGGTDWKSVLQRLLAPLGVAEMPDGISRFGRLHRAYVKVQDGCNRECSYCIVPRVRPKLWSRPVAEVLAEVRRLVDHGHVEIVLTGIHLGHYGLEMEDRGWGVWGGGCKAAVSGRGRSLEDLVRRILSLDGRFRVRLSSLEAAELSPGLLALMADHPDRICPHLHIPLQSGSDAVLAQMRRRYTSGQFLERCEEIRQSLDQPALTTDVIVGFPGETEADFEATCRVVEEGGFSKVHVFRFSAREGTPAATMPDQVPSPVKHRRARALAALGCRLQQRYCESLLGRFLEVLVEGPAKGSPGLVVGTADRYVQVEIPAGPDRLHRLVLATAEEAVGGRIHAAVHPQTRAPEVGISMAKPRAATIME